jgi:hypothetical protein
MPVCLRPAVIILAFLGLELLGWWLKGHPPKEPSVALILQKPATPAAVPTPSSSQAQPRPDQGKVVPSGKFEPEHFKTQVPQIPNAEAMHSEVKDYIKQISQNEVHVGEVRLLKKERTLIFPATLAERHQPLEYALVHETGKTHEALLMTKVPVQDVHVAALLIDATGQPPTIEVSWRKNGGEAKMMLSDLIRVQQSPADTLSANPWTYNGSKFIHGGFAAMREGSMVALVNDPSALVNHQAAGDLMRDDVFFANPEKLPPDGVGISVSFIFWPRQ